MGLMPHRSQARVKSGMLLKSTGPCSPSSHIPSNPRGPKCSMMSPFNGPIGMATISPLFKLFLILLSLSSTIIFTPFDFSISFGRFINTTYSYQPHFLVSRLLKTYERFLARPEIFCQVNCQRQRLPREAS